MAKANFAFSNFTAGELSPRLGGRTDLSKYYNGCNQLTNFLVHPHGGASRRPGTRYVAACKSASAKSRLVLFQFNTEQAYILEFFNNGFRIYKDGGQVTSGSPAAAVEVTTTYTTAQLDALKFAQSADIMYVVHPDHPPRKISRTSHTAWTITDIDFQRGPLLDINVTDTTLTANARTGSSITISASAVTGINDGAGFTAGVDVGRIVKLHHGYAKITAVTNTTTVTATALENEDYIAELEPTYASNTISFKEGAPSTTNLEHNDRIIDSAKQFVKQGFVKGMTVTVSGASTGGNNTDYLLVEVTEDTLLLSPSDDCADESASATITIVGKLEADTDWRLGAFYIGSYPSTVAIYEQRLVFASTANQPQTLYFSTGGDYENFTPGVDADSALTYTIGSNTVDVIRYLSSSRALLLGTSGGEFAVRSSGTDEPLTPTNAQIKKQSAYGSADVQPVQAGNAVLFLHRALRKVRELTYSYNTDSYVAPDLTILSEHITENGVSEMAYQQEPDSIVWMVRADGVLLGMTYRREEQVVAWHEHKIGGTYTGTHGSFASATYDYGLVESVATVPSATEDELYLIVKRTVNGSTARYIEYMKSWDFGTDLQDAFFVDSGLTFTGETSTLSSGINATATTVSLADASAFTSSGVIEIGTEQITYTGKSTNDLTGCTRGSNSTTAATHSSGATVTQTADVLSGLSHLEGQTVDILEEGATHPDLTVSSGAITLQRETTKAHVGLPFTSTLQTMRLEAGATDGTAQGKIKRIDEVTVRLFRTVNALVGANATNLDRIAFRSGADAMDAAIPLFTGDKEIEMDAGYDQDGFVMVQQDLALPMTIISIIARAQTFD